MNSIRFCGFALAALLTLASCGSPQDKDSSETSVKPGSSVKELACSKPEAGAQITSPLIERSDEAPQDSKEALQRWLSEHEELRVLPIEGFKVSEQSDSTVTFAFIEEGQQEATAIMNQTDGRWYTSSVKVCGSLVKNYQD